MVFRRLTAIDASFLGPLDDRQKMTVLGIFENPGQLTSQPVFVAIGVDVTQALKGGVMFFGDALLGHTLHLR